MEGVGRGRGGEEGFLYGWGLGDGGMERGRGETRFFMGSGELTIPLVEESSSSSNSLAMVLFVVLD